MPCWQHLVAEGVPSYSEGLLAHLAPSPVVLNDGRNMASFMASAYDLKVLSYFAITVWILHAVYHKQCLQLYEIL